MSAVAQPSGTVTMVFTDIEGSTRLLEHLGVEAYREALTEHRRIVREACARHSGYEVDAEGDAFFYAFATPQAAVTAVSEAMRGLDRGPIRIRVGIHTGHPELDPPNYIGIDIHRAARIMASGHGGQVVLSPSTVALLERGSVVLKQLGEHRLKDLSVPIQLYQLELDGLPDSFPPLKTLYRSNLPVPATPFIGRESELGEVIARLADPTIRLLTLTGPGGTGKTRLALQGAAETADGFPDGISWVALAPLRDPALVLSAIAVAVEVRERADEPIAATLAKALLGKQALLMLDNLEHLLPSAAADIAALMTACPSLRVLATSRAPLGVGAERVWGVPPMTASDGERLFVERAAAAGVELEPDDAVRTLCRRLDELPLAIRLAAARTRSLSPAAILERIDPRLTLLSSRAADTEERQRTLEATISWSYDLLAPNEQRVLRALSVFAGGCTLEAAEAVSRTTLDELETLLDQSLVNYRKDEAAQDRYWMLETIREYAGNRLAMEGEAVTVRAAHAHTYARLLAPLWRKVRDHDEAATVALDADLANGRLALRHALDVDDATTAAHLLGVLELPLLRRGSNREAMTYADRYLGLDRSSLDPATRLDGDIGAGEILRFSGEVARAQDVKEGCLMLARQFPDAELLGRSTTGRSIQMSLLTNLSSLELSAGETAKARAYAIEALALRRAAGNPRGVAHALNGVLNVDHVEGRYEDAAAHATEAADLMASVGSPEEHFYRVSQAESELLCGRHANAAVLLTEHPPLPPPQDDVLELTYWLTVGMSVLASYERHAEAAAVGGAAAALLGETGLVMSPWEAERFQRTLSRSRELGQREPGRAPTATLSATDAVEVLLISLGQMLPTAN